MKCLSNYFACERARRVRQGGAYGLLAIFSVALLAGCESSRDVSSEPAFQRGFAVGQTYRLNVPAAIYSFNEGQPCELYRLDDPRIARFSSSIVQIVPAGSRFRVERLVHVVVNAPVQGESFVRVFVTVLNIAGTCSDSGLVTRLSNRQTTAIAGWWPTVIPLPDSDVMTLED
jgi:hypothetical protein